MDGCLRSNGVWRLKRGRALRCRFPQQESMLILFFISFAIFKRKETVGLWFCNLWLKRCWCVTWSFVIYGIISLRFKQDIHNSDNNGLLSILNNYFAVLDADNIKSVPDINILLKRLSPKKLSFSVKIITKKKSIYWLCCQSYHGAVRNEVCNSLAS